MACTGNELGLAPDGGGGGDYPQKCPPSPCRDRASGVKTRPALPRNEHYLYQLERKNKIKYQYFIPIFDLVVRDFNLVYFFCL